MRGKNGVFQKLKTDNVATLLDVGSCTLHSVHNSVKYGLQELSVDVNELAINVWSFFHNSSNRREEYKELQSILNLEEHLFQKHSRIRWLSLLPVVERLLEQKEGLVEYMFTRIPSKDSYTSKLESYKSLANKLKDPLTWPTLHFVAHALKPFQEFETLFQKKEPLIPYLYENLSELVRKTMKKFVTSKIVGKKEGKELLEINYKHTNNQVDDRMLSIGDSTRKLISLLSEKDKKRFFHEARMVYMKIVEKMLQYFCLESSSLRFLSFLNPVSANLPGMRQSAIKIARILSNVISPEELEILQKPQEGKALYFFFLLFCINLFSHFFFLRD